MTVEDEGRSKPSEVASAKRFEPRASASGMFVRRFAGLCPLIRAGKRAQITEGESLRGSRIALQWINGPWAEADLRGLYNCVSVAISQQQAGSSCQPRTAFKQILHGLAR